MSTSFRTPVYSITTCQSTRALLTLVKTLPDFGDGTAELQTMMLTFFTLAAISFSAPETSLQITCAPPSPWPPPAGSPPAAPTSHVRTPVSLGLSWPSQPGAELYDVHVSLATKWDPFVSLTSESNSAVVLDLMPGTVYLLAVRSRGPHPRLVAPWATRQLLHRRRRRDRRAHSAAQLAAGTRSS